LYSTCLFCFEPLGRNEEIEKFSVGRRLAFDPERGRLWVVCRNCRRWNLTPLEERWEAIDDCERRFRESRLRVSTANIGLARVGSGLELIRIGAALRAELAVWRYGAGFLRRRRRHLVATGVGFTAIGALWTTGFAFGATAAFVAEFGGAALMDMWSDVLTVARVGVEDGRWVRLTRGRIRRAELGRDEWTRDWMIGVAHPTRDGSERSRHGTRQVGPLLWLAGRDARRAAAVILPRVNGSGAVDTEVQDAVRFLEEKGTGDAAFHAALDYRLRRTRNAAYWNAFAAMVPGIRLALEMAAHEDIERRALEGELAELERAWREAEEVAAIADDLLIPASMRRSLARLRGHRTDREQRGRTPDRR
jgi:hypothetical protein